jgi:hypothetical protein
VSKWQQPTQKGTELFPRATPPPAVRFKGVPPGPDTERLRRALAPQINHFHRAQAQKYSLSTVENYRAHETYPGLKMTYTNLQGQETINIEVDTSILESVKQEQTRRLPSWAVARFTLPNVIGDLASNTAFLGAMEVYAVLRAGGAARESLQLAEGIPTDSPDFAPWYKPFRVLAFAGTSSDRSGPYGPMPDPDATTLEMELLVDLRPFWTPSHAPELAIDIYACSERQDPNWLYGYGNQETSVTSQDTWITGAQIAAAPSGAGGLAYYQGLWDAAGLPHSQQSYFVDGQELVLNESLATATMTFPLRDSPGVSAPTITEGLPNFITNPPAGTTTDGWRYMVVETSPATGLITAWGFNNLIWETIAGDPFPTVFVLTTGLALHHLTIVPTTGYINNPHTGPGNVYGQVFFEDERWFEREWTADQWQKWYWATTSSPDIQDHPLIARDVPWPDELLPTTGALPDDPPPIKQDRYRLGTLLVDLETASIGFSKA